MEFVSPRVAAVIIVVCVVALAAAPQSAVQESRASAAAASELEILRIRPNFYMIAGADANLPCKWESTASFSSTPARGTTSMT